MISFTSSILVLFISDFQEKKISLFIPFQFNNEYFSKKKSASGQWKWNLLTRILQENERERERKDKIKPIIILIQH